MNTFANNLKYLRIQKKLNQDALAKKIGISRSVLSYYESGKSDPTLSILYKIAIFFNISLDSLVSDNLSNDNFNINLDFYYNKFSISNLLKNLEDSKDYYLKEKERLTNIINFDIPNKIDEIDEIINFINLLHSNISYTNSKSDISINDSNEITATLEKDNISLKPSSYNYFDYDDYFSSKFEDVDGYTSVPLIGYVAAGNPRDAIEQIENYYSIPSDKLDANEQYFLLRVKGDSMNKLYENNDIILVRKQSYADNGKLVIALLNDCEATFKRYHNCGNIITLQPESTNPIHTIQEYSNDEVTLLGIVLGSLREYVE